jgi:hypothetical protein
MLPRCQLEGLSNINTFGDPNQLQQCPIPDVVHTYKGEGALPVFQYQVGFNQGVSACLQDQCTDRNLAFAIAGAAWRKVALLLSAGGAVQAIQTTLNSPGLTSIQDPYLRGKAQGDWVCRLYIQSRVFVKGAQRYSRVPLDELFPPTGSAIRNPTSFDIAVKTMPVWIKQVNPTGNTRNCGIGAIRVIQYMMGSPLYEAPATCQGVSPSEFNSLIGGEPVGPLDSAALQTQLNQLPVGAVGALEINPGDGAGHVVAVVKASNGQILLPDPQYPGAIPLSKIMNPTYKYTFVPVGSGLMH